jgi:triosephosphate isomerase
MDPELRKPLIVGNWKMYGTIGEAIKLATTVHNLIAEMTHLEVAVAPPFTALHSVSVALADSPVKLAGQNLLSDEEGPFTGEISGLFLKDIGCKFVIVGHSERRHQFGETDKMVGQKVGAALKSDLIPILCVGETLQEREKNQTMEVVDRQLKRAFLEINLHDFEDFVVAYEPVWAIGTGKTATPEQAGEVHHFIRAWLTKNFDAPTANGIRLLYGGSVKPENARSLMEQKDVDGLLVGSASLNAESFARIVKFEEREK